MEQKLLFHPILITVTIGILMNLLETFVVTLGNIFHVNLLGYSHCFMSIIIYHIRDRSISVDKARYATSVVDKYLDTATVKTSIIFYNTTYPYDMIFTKADSSTKDEQIGKLTREFNIQYRSCIGSLIYLLSTRVDFSFAVHKLTKFSSNPGKVNFEGLVHLLINIRDNKTLGLNYYSDMKDAPLSDHLIQTNIKTENQLMAFSDSIWQDGLDIGRITGA